ncbi:MAG: acyl--CoA ligase, partial [Bacteroidetes bacterium]|nr:acyl--CoA ligase [Bacteroidota bacterium]
MKRKPKLYQVPQISSVQDMLLKSAATHGEKLALEDLKETPIPRVSYAALLRNVLKFGTALRQLGIPERSHIAIIGENRVQWGIAYLTAMCFNYVVVPIDRNLTPNEILNILHESDATAVIFSETFDPLFREQRHAVKQLKHCISMDLLAEKNGFHSMPQMIGQSKGCTVEALPHIDPT